MEEGSVKGKKVGVGGGQHGKEVAEEWEREVGTPGTEEGTGPKGSQAKWGDQGRGGQTTKGKATGSEEKWGKEEGSGERGHMAVPSLGSGSKGDQQEEWGTREQVVRQSCPKGEGGRGVEWRPSRERDREKES